MRPEKGEPHDVESPQESRVLGFAQKIKDSI